MDARREYFDELEKENQLRKQRLENELNFLQTKTHLTQKGELQAVPRNLNYRVLTLSRRFDLESQAQQESCARINRGNNRSCRELQGKYEYSNEKNIKVEYCEPCDFKMDAIRFPFLKESPKILKNFEKPDLDDSVAHSLVCDEGSSFYAVRNTFEMIGQKEAKEYAKGKKSRLRQVKLARQVQTGSEQQAVGEFVDGGVTNSRNGSYACEGNNEDRTQREGRTRDERTGGERTRDERTGGERARKLSHQEATRLLLKQAIDQSDFALLRVMLRMSPFVKDGFKDKDNHGNNLMHRCCKDGNLRLATILIEAGVDVNVTGEKDQTPLHFASLSNKARIAQLLLNSCADVHKKDAEGSRPVDLCTDPRLRTMLLRRMSTRARSFSKSRPTNIRKDREDDGLKRTDSGIVIDDLFVSEQKENMLSSYRDFRFSKETMI